MCRIRSQASQAVVFVNTAKMEPNVVFPYVSLEHGREAMKAARAKNGVESCYVGSSLCKVTCALDGALVLATLFDPDGIVPIGQIRWQQGYIIRSW